MTAPGDPVVMGNHDSYSDFTALIWSKFNADEPVSSVDVKQANVIAYKGTVRRERAKPPNTSAAPSVVIFCPDWLSGGTKASVKLHLAAIRALFVHLIMRQVVDMNPAHSVRGPRLVVTKGKTPPLTPEDASRIAGTVNYKRKYEPDYPTVSMTPQLLGVS